MSERGNWNRSARRSGGYRPIPIAATPPGILVGVPCDGCGEEKIAVAPGIEPRCLACGKVQSTEGNKQEPA